MEERTYFIKHDERATIQDFKAYVNIYATDGGGRVSLAATAVGDSEAEAMAMARHLVDLLTREGIARKRLEEIDGAIKGLDDGIADMMEQAGDNMRKDMMDIFPEKGEGEVKSITARHRLGCIDKVHELAENYLRTVRRLQTEREAILRTIGEGEK